MNDSVIGTERTPTPQFKHALEQAQQWLERVGFHTELAPWCLTVFRRNDTRRLASVMPWTPNYPVDQCEADVIGWLSAPYEAAAPNIGAVIYYREHRDLNELVAAVANYSRARELADEAKQSAYERTFEYCLSQFLYQSELHHAPGQPWDIEETLRKGKAGVTKDPTLSRIQRRLEAAYPSDVLKAAIRARESGARLPALFVFAMAVRFSNNRSWCLGYLDKVTLDEQDIADFLRFRRALGGYGRRVRDVVAACRRVLASREPA